MTVKLEFEFSQKGHILRNDPPLSWWVQSLANELECNGAEFLSRRIHSWFLYLIQLLRKGKRHASVRSRALRLYLWKTCGPWNMFVSVFTVYHGDKGLLYPTMSFCHGAQPHDIPEIAKADEYWLNPWAKINSSSFQYIFLGYLLTRLESWVIHWRLGQACFFFH